MQATLSTWGQQQAQSLRGKRSRICFECIIRGQKQPLVFILGSVNMSSAVSRENACRNCHQSIHGLSQATYMHTAWMGEQCALKQEGICCGCGKMLREGHWKASTRPSRSGPHIRQACNDWVCRCLCMGATLGKKQKQEDGCLGDIVTAPHSSGFRVR